MRQGDPVGDRDMLWRDVRKAGISRRRPVFVSYFVSFRDRSQWQLASAKATMDGWLVSAYRASDGYVLRLSGSELLSERRFERDVVFLHRLTKTTFGDWTGFAIEDLPNSNRWDELADRCGTQLSNKVNRVFRDDRTERLAVILPRQRQEISVPTPRTLQAR